MSDEIVGESSGLLKLVMVHSSFEAPVESRPTIIITDRNSPRRLQQDGRLCDEFYFRF